MPAAFVLGLMSGALVVWLGLAGLVIAIGLALLAILPAPRLRTVAGLLFGASLGMVVAVLLAASRCPVAIGQSAERCEGPDLRGFLLVAMVLTAVAVAILVITRSRRSA